MSGKHNVITFCENAKSILREYYNLPKEQDPETEKLNLIETLAKIIRNEVKQVNTPSDLYQGIDELHSVDKNLEFISASLRLLRARLMPGENCTVVQASIGQAIMQAMRSRALLAPLQIGLAVQRHRHFASRFLIDTLNKLGFCS